MVSMHMTLQEARDFKQIYGGKNWKILKVTLPRGTFVDSVSEGYPAVESVPSKYVEIVE